MGNDMDYIRPRVLIGFSEALSAMEVAWDMLDAGFKVTVFARKGKRSPLSYSKDVEIVYVTPPEIDADETIRCLEQHIEKQKYDALMPLEDAAVWVCDNLSKKLNLPIAGPVGENRNLALDKRLQLRLAEKCGFSIPPTRYINTTEELLQCNEYPAVLKPAFAIMYSKGRLVQESIKICMNKGDIENFLSEWNKDMPYIAQPFLHGVGVGIFAIAACDRVRNWSSHQRIRMMNPAGSGSSACKSIAVEEALAEPASKMMEITGWKGLFMIELLQDDLGRKWFMEINGRPWGSMALALRRGLHYPVWAVRQAMERGFIPPEVCPGKDIICRHLGREIVHLLMVLHGPKFNSAVRWPSRTKTLLNVLRYSRDDYWYNWRPGNSSLFLYDTIQTIANKVFPKK